MRLKFKPNVSAPRGSSTSGSGEAGGGVRGGGGGGEAKKKRQRQRSRGDESAGTEGESSSDLETSESTLKKRRRRTNEHSGAVSQLHSAVNSAEKSLTQSNKESGPKRTTSISGSVSQDTSTVNLTQSVETSKSSASVVESESTSGDRDKRTSSSDCVPKDVQSTTSTAGQVQSTADSALQSISLSVTRGNSAAAVTGGRTTSRIKKKVAPKVVSTRPKRVSPSPAVAEGKGTSSQREDVEHDVARTDKSGDELNSTIQNSTQRDSGYSSVCDSLENPGERPSGISPPLISANVSTNQTSDEAISNTLNEVLCNTHSQEPEDAGLAGIVPSRFGLLSGLTASEDLHGDGLHGDSILITAQQSDHTEIEVRTESADVSKTTDISGTTAPVVNSDLLNSEQSYVYQSCTDGASRTSESPRSTGKNSQSSSPSSSQGSTTRSRRSGSTGERSRRSQSRASSVGSEVSAEGGKEAGQSGSKGKKRQRQKRTPIDTNEPNSQGTSPSAKRSRVSVVKVREAPDRSTMTMQELIYYNPSANPMSSSVEDKKKKREDGQPGNGQDSRASSVQPTTAGSRGTSPASQETRGDQDKDNGGESGRIVPTLRIGVDGKIIVDENSMVMETTQQDTLEDMGEIIVDSAGHTTSASYRQRCRVTRWTKEETGLFFKALSQVGTDFTMMTLLIPKRSRKELKNKFKKEERSNPHLVSQALSRT